MYRVARGQSTNYDSTQNRKVDELTRPLTRWVAGAKRQRAPE
jgi:hypothetical protein